MINAENEITKNWKGSFEKPLLSITCIAYNHEKYIEEAINGFLIQKTDFPFEIIIHDDASEDATQQIILKYAEKYPNIIIPILQKENHWLGKGINATATIVWPSTRGKYIAWCEGDDYWTDPLKLQRQIDFLESNFDYNICFHNVSVFNQNKRMFEKNSITREVPHTTDINDLSKGNFIHTPSVVFRNNFLIPDWFSETSMADWSLYMIVAKDKKIKKFDEAMAVYRVHNDSIWSQKTNEFRILNTIKSYKLILSSIDLEPKTKEILKTSIENLENHLPKKTSFIDKVFNKIKKHLVFKLF